MASRSETLGAGRRNALNVRIQARCSRDRGSSTLCFLLRGGFLFFIIVLRRSFRVGEDDGAHPLFRRIPCLTTLRPRLLACGVGGVSLTAGKASDFASRGLHPLLMRSWYLKVVGQFLLVCNLTQIV
jgi:hypothetical protein